MLAIVEETFSQIFNKFIGKKLGTIFTPWINTKSMFIIYIKLPQYDFIPKKIECIFLVWINSGGKSAYYSGKDYFFIVNVKN